MSGTPVHNPPTLRWDVELVDGEFHDVDAVPLEVVGGALVFYDEADVVLVAYGLNRWIAVSKA